MAVHFIGFSDSASFWRATQVFGQPDFIHPRWDVRAKQGGEWAEGDVRVFATGSEDDTPSPFCWDDSVRF
jgi:hypothetical protein